MRKYFLRSHNYYTFLFKRDISTVSLDLATARADTVASLLTQTYILMSLNPVHGEMNRFLITKTTREMRVVPSYGPNIPSKVL